MDRILNNIYIWWKDGRRFYKKRVRIPNRLCISKNPGSNDEGDGHGEGNENVKRNEPNK